MAISKLPKKWKQELKTVEVIKEHAEVGSQLYQFADDMFQAATSLGTVSVAPHVIKKACLEGRTLTKDEADCLQLQQTINMNKAFY